MEAFKEDSIPKQIQDKIDELIDNTTDNVKKIEYMMDFGAVAVLVNMSLN